MVTFLVAGAGAAPPAKENARRLYQEATSAYGLGNYSQAAELYEKAFGAKADPALLYNAAQAHRMAGHGDRALELYRNYLRLFPMADQGAEAQRHIDSLAHPAQPAATTPPATATGAATATPAPPPVIAPVIAPAVSPVEAASDRSVATLGADLTAQPAPPENTAAHKSRKWIWIGAGAAVVLGAVALTVALSSGGAKDPSPTLGIVGPH